MEELKCPKCGCEDRWPDKDGNGNPIIRCWGCRTILAAKPIEPPAPQPRWRLFDEPQLD